MTTRPLDKYTLCLAANNMATKLGYPDLWWVFYDLLDGTPLRRPLPPELTREFVSILHTIVTGES